MAIVLGSLLALAVARFRFFGRETIAFIVILPLALPGIVTGLALNTAFRAIGFDFGVTTIIVGHATFCVVVIYNNAIARLRRTSRSFEEASTDLGADTFTTFRRITWPAIRTALIAGALLAFALSFDEIIVTNFLAGPGVQTLPIWIFNNYQRPNQLPARQRGGGPGRCLLSIIPVYVASRLTEDPASVAGRADLGDPSAGPAPGLPLQPVRGQRDRDGERERARDRDKGVEESPHGAPPPAAGRTSSGGRPPPRSARSETAAPSVATSA